MLATIEQDTAVTRVPAAQTLPVFGFAWWILFIMHLPVTAQHFCTNFNCICTSKFLNFWVFSPVQEKVCSIKCNRNNSIVLLNKSARRKQIQNSFDRSSSLGFYYTVTHKKYLNLDIKKRLMGIFSQVWHKLNQSCTDYGGIALATICEFAHKYQYVDLSCLILTWSAACQQRGSCEQSEEWCPTWAQWSQSNQA